MSGLQERLRLRFRRPHDLNAQHDALHALGAELSGVYVTGGAPFCGRIAAMSLLRATEARRSPQYGGLER